MFTFADSLEEWREKNPGSSARHWRTCSRLVHDKLKPRFKPLVLVDEDTLVREVDESMPGTWSQRRAAW